MDLPLSKIKRTKKKKSPNFVKNKWFDSIIKKKKRGGGGQILNITEPSYAAVSLIYDAGGFELDIELEYSI